MTAAHGGVYLTLRTEGAMQARARKAAIFFIDCNRLFCSWWFLGWSYKWLCC